MLATTARLHVIGARAAFQSDPAWLQALARLSRALRGLPSASEVVVQVRIEAAREDAEELSRHALDTVRSAAPPALRVVLNAPDVDAVACGYDGVHWPERRIPERPEPCGGSRSASVHSRTALRRAERAGVDHVQFGPIWEPTWKAAAPQGVDVLAQLVRAARVPVIAVGGVHPQRVATCLAAGVHGVAVVSGVFGAVRLESALRQYLGALDPAGFA